MCVYIYIYVQLHAVVAHYILVAAVLLLGVFCLDFRRKLQEAALAALTAEKAAAEKAGPKGREGANYKCRNAGVVATGEKKNKQIATV